MASQTLAMPKGSAFEPATLSESNVAHRVFRKKKSKESPTLQSYGDGAKIFLSKSTPNFDFAKPL